MTNKKVVIAVQVRDNSGFSIECSTSLSTKRHFVAEGVESLTAKVETFLRKEFGGDRKG